jgi:ApbE superfamily uncharacterized protein (UPF0280 family)
LPCSLAAAWSRSVDEASYPGRNDVPLGARRYRYVDVPVQDMVLRVSAPADLYEEVRATGMQVWEQLQSYAIRDPAFRTSTRPVKVPEDAPPIVRQVAAVSAAAGVGPMFAFNGAVVEFVGRTLTRNVAEVVVECGGDYYIDPSRRSRLRVHGGTGGFPEIAVVVRPELGRHGLYTSMGGRFPGPRTVDAVVVAATSCILADSAAAAACLILARPRSFSSALAYLEGLAGVHGAMLVRDRRIGFAGGLEVAA